MGKCRIAFVAAVLAGSLAGTAWATSVAVTKTARRVTFTVENSSPSALVCDGTLTAKTKSGKFLEAKMKKETVKPGASDELFIVTDDVAADPLVDGWSDIVCVSVPPPAPPADPQD